MKHSSRSFHALFCLTLTITSSYAQTLPVFQVRASQAGEAGAVKLAQQLFGLSEVRKSTNGDKSSIIVQSTDGTKRVEFDNASGGFWAADDTQLWNTNLKPKLVDEKTAIRMADEMAGKYGWLPEVKGPLKLARGRIGGTFFATEEEIPTTRGQYKRQEQQLDVSVNYDITIAVQSDVKTQQEFPIIGGGGKFQVTFGDSGKLIGYQGLWRDIVEAGTKQYNVIPKAKADAQFLASAKKLSDTIDANSTIAYFSAPYGEFQEVLYPVYVYDGTAKVGNETIQLRRSYVPATEFGPINTFVPENLPARKPDPPAVRHRSLRPRTLDDGIFEAGTEWLGVPYGLSNTEKNAKGFRDQLVAGNGGWKINFNFGNDLVWESDFNAQDDLYVDSVDFLFYTGHANQNGWLATVPSTGATQMVHHSIVGTSPGSPGDLWGQQDLDWMVIAACGPLQDAAFISGGGSAFDRWRGAFDGLHIMFAYGTVSGDTDDEGHRLIKYAQGGAKLIDAWFRTAKELQGGSVIVTAMWAKGSQGDSRDDHLLNYGYVSGDNVGIDQTTRTFMWSTC